MRILLVEDDLLLGEGMQRALEHEQYAVDWVKDGERAIFAASVDTFDLIVLDLGLPKKSGLEVLKHIRNKGNMTPVLILTARDDPNDRVAGLDAGADDYMAKPFDLKELCARLRALLRRTQGRASPVIEYGDLVIDPAARSITKNGGELQISPREFAIVEKLFDNIGKALTRDQLAQSLYGWEEELDSNSLDVHIHNIRKKIGKDVIQTIRGIGYIVKKK